MGVTGISQFKSGMQQAQQSVKTLDAELKLNEKQLQASGDKEAYMQQKSKLLQQQIAAQNKVVQQGQQALAAMTKNGVDPASSSYQKMQQQVLNAQTALLGMETDLQNVGAAAQATATQSDKMADSLNSINKKVSFDAVLGGIGKITDGMERAARRIAGFATDAFSTMASAAAWADDEMTLASMYGIDVERLQKMQKVAANEIQAPVEAILKGRQRLKTLIASGSSEYVDVMQALGLGSWQGGKYGGGFAVKQYNDIEDAFWDIGEALYNYGDEIQRDAYFQKIFGEQFASLRPLFEKGRDVYEQTLAEQSAVSEENVGKLNELSAALKDLKQDYESTKNTLLSELAPAFTEVTKTLSGLIQQFNEYLQTDEGKEKLSELSDAVTSLFQGLTNVDFGQALDVAKSVLDGIVGALTWIKDNKDGVILAIKGIGGAFLVLKAAEVVGTLAKAASGLKTLLGSNGANTALNAANAAANASRLVQSGGNAETLVTGMPLLAQGLTNPILWAADGVAAAYAMANKIKDAGGLGNFLSQAIPTSEDLERSANGLDLLISGKVRRGSLLHGIGITSPGGSTDTDDRIKNPSGRPIGRNKGTVGEVSDDFLAWAEQEHESPYEEVQAKKTAQSMIEGIYGEIIRAVDEYDPRTNPDMNTSDYFDTVLYPKILQAAAMHGMDEDAAGGIADDFYNQWINMWYSNWPGTSSDLVENMKKALERDGKGLQLPVEPTLPENAAQLLSDEIGAVKVPVDLVWPDGIDGSNANGLPFVPYDGYISLLHKGERIVPANQNKNYNVYNNTYFDRTQVSGGVDADGLAARIVTAQKRALSAVGS